MTTQAQQMIEFVNKAKDLRGAAVEAEADFLHHLMIGEENVAMWRGDPGAKTGYTTFMELLATTDLCKPDRYEAFKTSVARFGWESVRRVGFGPSRLALRIPPEQSSRARPALSADAAAMIELEEWRERNHTTPSKQHSAAIIRKHYEPAPAPKVEKPEHQVIIEKLRAENVSLTRELAKTKSALASAMERLDAYESGHVVAKTRSPLATAKTRVGALAYR